ncbi:hypothetical protein AB0Q95_45395 [Streptomyces sp. NPDC059900]
MCKAVGEALPVEAVSMTLFTHLPEAQLLCASHDLAVRLAELQFETGQGPSVAASATGQPAIWGDVSEVRAAWPVFGSLVREQLPRIGALYAIPLLVGRACLGSLDLARGTPMDPGARLRGEMLRGARAAAEILNAVLSTAPWPHWQPAEIIDTHWNSAHRASGKLAELGGVPPSLALDWMRARAFASGRPLPELADEILRSTRPDPP